MNRLHAWVLAVACCGAAWAQAPEDAAVRDWLKMVELDSGPTIRARLAAGQDPNVLGERGHAALHWALRHQSAAAVQALLDDPRTDVNKPNALGESPLALAALRAQLPWVKALVARGALVNAPADGTRWQALHYAASGEDHGVIAWLLEQGANIDARSPNGSTPLMMAWGYGSVDGARLLMKRGARTDLRNEQGLSAWDFAKRGGREDLAKRAGLQAAP
jgi:ankyrin repeat protein